MPPHTKLITGQTFGRLTAVSHADGYQMWLCKCTCGTEVDVSKYELTSGRKVSCGCLKREKTLAAAAARRYVCKGGSRRGLSATPAYMVWGGMIQRCSNPANRAWIRYGGRGIGVCERWLCSESFIEDMGQPPPGTSLDRIDNDGDYEPGNCRWATPLEQAANKSNNYNITFSGSTHHLAEWARRFGVKMGTLRARLQVRSVDEVFEPLLFTHPDALVAPPSPTC